MAESAEKVQPWYAALLGTLDGLVNTAGQAYVADKWGPEPQRVEQVRPVPNPDRAPEMVPGQFIAGVPNLAVIGGGLVLALLLFRGR